VINVEVVYVKEAGVLGLVTHSYPDGAKRIRYYVDGLGYDMDMDVEEFEIKVGVNE
jgi:hypothetical protein